MSFAVSILIKEKLYYQIFPNTKPLLTVGEDETSDVVIPDIGMSLTITRNRDLFHTEIAQGDKTDTVVSPLYKSTVIDRDRRIALFFSEETGENGSFGLDYDGVYYFGRSRKASKDGITNDAVLEMPFVSGFHFRVRRTNGETYISDMGSTNGLYLDGKKLKGAEEIRAREGDVINILTIRILLKDDKLHFYNIGEHFFVNRQEETAAGTAEVVFERSPRMRLEVPCDKIEITALPPQGEKPEINWFSTLLPLGATLLLAVVMAAVMSNAMMMAYTLPMTISGLIVTIYNYKKQTKKYEEQTEITTERYTNYLNDKIKDIEEQQSRQRRAMLWADPEAKDCVAIAANRESRLWERTPEDSDFLEIRLGRGDVPSGVQIVIPKRNELEEQNELQARPQQIYDKYRLVADMPILCDLPEDQVWGVVGDQEDALRLMQNLAVEIAALHCYTEVRLVCICDKKQEEQLKWLRKLPHAETEAGEICMAADRQRALELFDAFAEVLKKRSAEERLKRTYGSQEYPLPFYVFLIAQPGFLPISHPINEFLFRTENLGCGTVIMARSVLQLPKECSRIIAVSRSESWVYDRNAASTRTAFRLDSLEPQDLEAFGTALSPLISKEGVTVATIPKSCSFYEMLGISSSDQIDVGERWKSSDCTRSLSVPIGEVENGRKIFLDLHDGKNGHGAHGLVAGMTGYGKSELLQSIVLSLALSFSPSEVGFLIVDFKGGLASRLEGLPHILGVIKNVGSDYSEIARQLRMIKAEDKRRRLVFDQYSAAHEDKITHIDQYQKLFRRGVIREAMPHLVIVVDEFAEMKAEQPELIKDLVSTARLGRSQGIHLILATQKPGGIIDSQISSNSKFRICLKVEADQDSKDLLKTADAAHIRNDGLGRAFLRVGEEVYEEFQSAYSGAECSSPGEKGLDQFAALKRRITEYCRNNQIKKIPSILLPPLPEHITLPDGLVVDRDEPLVPIGIVDDPDRLSQECYSLPLCNANTLIIGSPQTGKTGFLHSVIHVLASSFSPGEVSIYIVDFASMELKKYETLGHVGGVVTCYEEERIRNLFRMLLNEIIERRQKLFAAGTGSFEEYKKNHADLPRIVLLIDNLTMLRDMYFQDDTDLLKLLRDGLSVGITVIAANAQTSGFYRLLPTFEFRIALYNTNQTEYISLFDHCRSVLPNLPGRCLVKEEGQLYYCQLFSAFSRDSDYSETIDRFIDVQNRKHNGRRARKIPTVPDTLTPEVLLDNCTDLAVTPFRIPLGIDYGTVAPTIVDMKRVSVLGIGGKSKQSQESFLRSLVRMLEKVFAGRLGLYILDSIDQTLKDMAEMPGVKGYSFLADAGGVYLAEIEGELKSRYEALAAGDTAMLETSPLLLLIINNPDACTYLSSNRTVMESMKMLTGRYRDMNVCVLVSQIPNAVLGYSSPEFYKTALEKKQILWLGDLQNYKLWSLPPSVMRDYRKPYKEGDGYMVKDFDCARIKLPIE